MPPSRHFPACVLVVFALSTLALPSLVSAQPKSEEPRPVPGRRMMRMSTPPAQSEGDSARVPGRKLNGMIVVPVEVNGAGPFWFAIDTGAMGHGRINASVAAKLGLAVAGKGMAVDPSGKNPREVDLYRVDSLRVGNVTFRGAIVTGSPDSIRKLEGVDGILGIDLFTDFVLALDYPRAELRISRGALPDTNGKDVLAFTRDRGPIIVPLRVGDREIGADLDTGNMIAPFVFPTDFAELLPRKDAPRSGGVVRTVANEVKIQLVTLTVPVRLGGIEFPNPEVAYPALHDRGNIGSKALADYTLEIDQRNKRLRLSRGSLEGSSPKQH